MKAKLYVLLILAFGFLATLNLWHSGFPVTHDGDVHLLRLTNFYQSLSDGIWIPRWAANVNWGYGQPVFEFFYPLPSYIGSLLHFLGLSFADSLKLMLGASLVLAGLSMYLWLSKVTSRLGAFFGSFLYMFAPYRLVDMYVRGDIGEVLALAFVPLVLYFMVLTVEKKSKYPFILGGISLALLILCHNIVSLVTLPFILFYAIYLWFYNGKKKSLALKFVLIIVLGFLLSVFFWLPGLFEAKYTLRDIVTKGEYAQRFVDFTSLLYGPWSYGGSGSFTVQIGIIQLLVILFSLLSLFVKKKSRKVLTSTILLYTGIAIFLMLPISNFFWAHIMLLQNFQFPWRFLLITIFSTAVLGGLFLEVLPPKIKLIMVGICILICFAFEYTYLHAKVYESRPDSTYAGIFKGPSDTGESSPIWGIRFMESGYAHPLEVLDGKASIKVLYRNTIKHTYNVTSQGGSKLIENTLYFPGWHVFVDGKDSPIEFQDEQHRGLMIFEVPNGVHSVSVEFLDTKFRKFADEISLLATFIVLLLLLPLPKRFKIKI